MTPRVVITVLEDGASTYTIEFERFPVRIGARPGNEVVLDHPWISGEHAVLDLRDDGLTLRDLSRNGCFLGSERVPADTPLGTDATVRMPPYELSIRLHAGSSLRLTELRPSEEILRAAGLGLQGSTSPPVSLARSASTATIRRSNPDDTMRETFPVRRSATREREQTAILPVFHAPPAPEAGPVCDGRSATLLVVKGPPGLEGARFRLDRPLVSIGRNPESDVPIAVPTVSWAHATLARRNGDAWVLTDSGSANGTLVDGERIREIELRPGAIFAVGRSVSLRLDGLESRPMTAGTSLPPLRITKRRGGATGAVCIIEISGRADVETFPLLSLALQESMEAGERFVVLALGGLEYVDHAGFSVIVQADGRLSQMNGELRLAGLSAKLRETLSLNRLDAVFRHRLFENEKRAVESTEKSRLSGS